MLAFYRAFLLLLCLAACASCSLGHHNPPRPGNALIMAGAPGVVHVKDSLYMDEAEVANIHWLEYLSFLRKDSSEAVYRAALPDTTVWTAYFKKLSDAAEDPYVAYYLRYPGFRYFPVVGITQQQAAAYCRWRSAKVAETFRAKPEFRRQQRRLGDYEVDVSFRLPTAAEWELCATGGLDPAQYPYGYEHPPQKVVKYRRVKEAPVCRNQVSFPAGAAFYLNDANVKEHYYYQAAGSQSPVYFSCEPVPQSDSIKTKARTSIDDWSLITQYVYMNRPNGYGLYNMIGNVAEITTTPDEAKGGSFDHTMQASRPQIHQPYTGPQAWLGFRCACTIRVRKRAADTAQ